MDYATMKAELKAEIMAELLGILYAKTLDAKVAVPEKPAQACFSLMLESHGDYNKLEKNKMAFGVFMKWYGKQKGYEHPRHAFNSLCKHNGFVLIERDPTGEWVKSGTKDWKV